MQPPLTGWPLGRSRLCKMGPSTFRKAETPSTVLGVVYYGLLAGGRASFCKEATVVPFRALLQAVCQRFRFLSWRFVGCELPQDLEQVMDAEVNPQESCASLLLYAIRVCDTPFVGVVPYWKAHFGRNVFLKLLRVFSLPAHLSKYSVILELDCKIRHLGFPNIRKTLYGKICIKVPESTRKHSIDVFWTKYAWFTCLTNWIKLSITEWATPNGLFNFAISVQFCNYLGVFTFIVIFS